GPVKARVEIGRTRIGIEDLGRHLAIGRVLPGLAQQDLVCAPGRQPMRHDRARRPAADNDVVVDHSCCLAPARWPMLRGRSPLEKRREGGGKERNTRIAPAFLDRRRYRLLVLEPRSNGDGFMSSKLKMLAIAAAMAAGTSSVAMAQVCPAGTAWNGATCATAPGYVYAPSQWRGSGELIRKTVCMMDGAAIPPDRPAGPALVQDQSYSYQPGYAPGYAQPAPAYGYAQPGYAAAPGCGAWGQPACAPSNAAAGALVGGATGAAIGAAAGGGRGAAIGAATGAAVGAAAGSTQPAYGTTYAPAYG